MLRHSRNIQIRGPEKNGESALWDAVRDAIHPQDGAWRRMMENVEGFPHEYLGFQIRCCVAFRTVRAGPVTWSITLRDETCNPLSSRYALMSMTIASNKSSEKTYVVFSETQDSKLSISHELYADKTLKNVVRGFTL
jgi:hypothetical protein